MGTKLEVEGFKKNFEILRVAKMGQTSLNTTKICLFLRELLHSKYNKMILLIRLKQNEEDSKEDYHDYHYMPIINTRNIKLITFIISILSQIKFLINNFRYMRANFIIFYNLQLKKVLFEEQNPTW